jgi:signal transduction histidine kinase
MKLQARLSLLVSLIILATSLAIGLFAITTSYSSRLSLLDSSVNQVADELSKSKDDPLSLSTYLADQSDQKFSVAYITQELELIPLYESSAKLINTPTKAQLIDSIDSPITQGELRLRTFQTSQGDYLVMFFSIKDLNQSRNEHVSLLMIFTLLVMILGVSLTMILFRKDNQLNSLVNSLKQNQKSMQEFIGDASHELRTPLTVIRGYFDLLRKNETNSGINGEYGERISSEISRMQEIIDDLLFITEIEDALESKNEVALISNLVQEQVYDLKNLNPQREIELEIEPNLQVQVSSYRLESLLANIFSNIRRHTPINSRVEITLQSKSNKIDLTIEDAGKGLPETFYDDGIQAFRRFDKSRSRETGGSGLGMTIIQKIVTKGGGQIWLSPSKFGGLKIQIQFPKV